MGLYFKNIIPFFLLFILISKYKNKILILIIFIFGILYVFYSESSFEKTKDLIESGKYLFEIVSENQEGNYTNKYTAKIIENQKLALKNKKVYILLDKEEIEFKIGDKILVYADKMEESYYKNIKQYDFSNYQKQSKIYGNLKVSKIIAVKKSKFISIKEKITSKLEKFFQGDEKALFFSIVIGNKNFISDDILKNFRKSGFSDIIAVSGTHIVYVISSSEKILKILNIGKRNSKIVIILILIFFYYIVGFSSSIGRAIIMSLFVQISFLFHKKKNTLNALFLSAFTILIYNPFLITNAGFILSYLGTIGILEFDPLINKKIMELPFYKKIEKEYFRNLKKYSNYEKEKIKINDSKLKCSEKIKQYLELYESTKSLSNVEKKVFLKYKIISSLLNSLSVSIAVNIFSIPASIYLFNSINFVSIISSIIVSPVVGGIVSVGIIVIFFSFMPKFILEIPIFILNKLLKIMLFSSKVFNCFSINVTMPSLIIVVIIYGYFIIKILIEKDKRILYKYLRKERRDRS